MPTAVWTGLIATVLYTIASLIAGRQLAGNLPLQRGAFLGLGSLALLFHACALWHLSVTDQGVLVHLFVVASLIGLTGSTLICIASIYRPLEWVSVLVFPYSALTIPAALWLAPVNTTAMAHGLGLHVLLSILAYATLALAACQAVLIFIQHQQLKHGHIRGVMRVFPPIQAMESILFELLWTGMIALTAAIVAGAIYVDDLFEQQVAHKTILTLASWCVFAVLLLGHNFLGWRSVRAVKLTLSGFVILLLGFFGSQFVLQYILQR